jgi:hypothetical protein
MLSAPALVAAVLTFGTFLPGVAHGAAPKAPTHPQVFTPNSMGGLDCNGLSPIQRPVKNGMMCADPRGGDGGRFFENGHYIGHDEPSFRFLSNVKGSGRNFKINETLPVDPAGKPTVKTPGKDKTHWFELSVAPWISTTVCDPNSAPILPCAPGSDANAPKGKYPGAGAAFVELQFYPPGFAPFQDSISCDNTHWCSALNIDSLECSGNGSGPCNNNCNEPVSQVRRRATTRPSPRTRTRC